MAEVEMNKDAKLSEHFTLGEMTKTKVKRLSNVPTHAAVLNLKNLCENWLELLREEWNKRYGEGDDPIVINSGFRSEAVNKAVGGVKGSNHLTGCAADIHVAGIEQLLRYAVILLDVADETKREFDELLVERSPEGGYWLHFAVRPSTEHSRASSPTRSLSGAAPNRRKVRIIQT